ncbi:AraC family transcriptional regulator [Microbacterium sp. NPDC091662]|uniref:helix-turn-helix transcriptional regulator n=1 Tax=Microbacterium sp. NPDC091662 TaxID=3364211 RepID=UPI003815C761
MPGTTSEKVAAHREQVFPDQHFEEHTHTADQLAWVPGGAHIRVGDTSWRLHGDHFAWVPALAEHEMRMTGAEEMFSLYLAPELRLPQARWSRPLALPVDPVAGAIVQSLCLTDADHDRLEASLVLLLHILEHTDESFDTLAVPADPRARTVAEAILAGPDDQHELDEWAEQLAVSTKTLQRAFQSETGLTFGQWRTRARLYAAERLIVEGSTVQEAADRSGYSTATGFIKAFRQLFGSTPAAYARAKRGHRPPAARRPRARSRTEADSSGLS